MSVKFWSPPPPVLADTLKKNMCILDAYQNGLKHNNFDKSHFFKEISNFMFQFTLNL